MEYRVLRENDLRPELFAHFSRRQAVTDCWRKADGRWVIRSEPFVDDWNEQDYARLVLELQTTANENGLVLGAFADGRLKGFAFVKAERLGTAGEYLDLTGLHVSEDMRGRGIGRTLFLKAKAWAKARGAKKLYISAQSSVETQAFYRAMGCVEAAEPSAEHIRKEPYDCQLECKL